MPKVERFLRKWRLASARFDGCAFGLRSCIEREKEKFLKKPWLIATNIDTVFSALDGRTCPGTGTDHEHSTTCGRNAKHSQYYTKELALAIHGRLQGIIWRAILGGDDYSASAGCFLRLVRHFSFHDNSTAVPQYSAIINGKLSYFASASLPQDRRFEIFRS